MIFRRTDRFMQKHGFLPGWHEPLIQLASGLFGVLLFYLLN
jgi:hypothetical protein